MYSGLRSSKYEDAALLQQKEAGWEGRIDIYEKIDDLSRKKFALHESGRDTSPGQSDRRHPRASSRSPDRQQFRQQTRPHSPIAATGAGADAGADASSHTQQHTRRGGHGHGHGDVVKKPSRRADFDGISENDLIANGLYTLAPQQLKTFNSFTDMISSFDNTDMVGNEVASSVHFSVVNSMFRLSV